MSTLRAHLAARRPLLLDGAMGTELLENGLAPGACPEALNLEQPELLSDIARRYAGAGADAVTTNTFGGSPLKLALYGLADRTEEINAAAVAAARRGAGPDVRVAGSCGPTGRLLEPYGDAKPAEVEEGFVRQIRALVEAGIDLLCVETMTDLTEAVLAVTAARRVSPSLPVTAAMTFDPTPRGFHTIMGVDIPAAAGALVGAGADAVGSNCGNGIDVMVAIGKEFATHTRSPLLAQANAGLPESVDGRMVYSETPEATAAGGRALLDAGVTILGGCCGTTPDHIRALRTMIDETHPPR